MFDDTCGGGAGSTSLAGVYGGGAGVMLCVDVGSNVLSAQSEEWALVSAEGGEGGGGGFVL